MQPPLDRILTLLQQIYPPEQAAPAYERILDMLKQVSLPYSKEKNYFSERNITLITYGNTLQHPGEIPFQTLYHFLQQYLKDVISTVHILPFYPYSSDDGFSVVDYYSVNPELGTWGNIREIGQNLRLMFDAVINHISAQSDWFEKFLSDAPGFEKLFITENPNTDLRSVVRPRTSPLLTPFRKKDGSLTHIWTTFSSDQVDLDYRNPDTLLRIFRVLLFYVEQGAQVLRLDAIAYLWKEIGTSCIHLSQTHAIVQLIRAVLDAVAPHVILITETNVPHKENISYFGGENASEAQLVYNFVLPPLLFYALQSGNATILTDWVNTLDTPKDETAFFNFTASHDGIGVRPLEGLLNSHQMQDLINKVRKSGGEISYKTNSDGSSSPYELNITYIDAIINDNDPPDLQVKRFLVSQGIMLALAGVPAIYIHSLLGSHNDIQGMHQAGYARAINRRKLSVTEIIAELNNPQRFRGQVFRGYTHLIRTRIQSPAFHPKARQRALSYNDGSVFALDRIALDESEHLLCLFNMTGHHQAVVTDLPAAIDLLSGKDFSSNLELAPYQICWLRYVQQ